MGPAPASLATLSERHRPEIVRYLARLLGDRDEAEDVCQEVFLRAHRAIVREELVKVFGQALDVKCTTLAPGQAPRPPVVDDVKPLIDRAIEFFDGEILDLGVGLARSGQHPRRLCLQKPDDLMEGLHGGVQCPGHDGA